MGDRVDNNGLFFTIDAADHPPVALTDAYNIRLALQSPRPSVSAERVIRKYPSFPEQCLTVAHTDKAQCFDGNRRDDQVHSRSSRVALVSVNKSAALLLPRREGSDIASELLVEPDV